MTDYNQKMKYILIVFLVLLSGCASPQNGNWGFEREYPFTFSPYPNSPSIAQCSFDNLINLSTLIDNK